MLHSFWPKYVRRSSKAFSSKALMSPDDIRILNSSRGELPDRDISAFENMSLAENNGMVSRTDRFTSLGNVAAGEDPPHGFDVFLDSTTPVTEPGSGTLLLTASGVLLIEKFRYELRATRRSRHWK